MAVLRTKVSYSKRGVGLGTFFTVQRSQKNLKSGRLLSKTTTYNRRTGEKFTQFSNGFEYESISASRLATRFLKKGTGRINGAKVTWYYHFGPGIFTGLRGTTAY